MSVSVKLVGFKELKAVFAELPSDIAKQAGEAALRTGAKNVLEESKRLVPADKGSLKESLGIKKVTTRNPALVIIARRGKKFGGWHANLVEFGTAAHVIKNVFIGGKFYREVNHPGTVPNPFLRPAFEGKKAKALKDTLESLVKHISNALKKATKK